ncbi:Thioredoxin [compost metagenome]
MKISNVSLALILFTLPFSSWARLTDGKVHLKVESTKIVAHIDSGFHFNKEAPASLQVDSQSSKPLKKEEKEIIFDASSVKGKSFSLNYYVCDDANTVCEEHEGSFKVQGNKVVAANTKAATPALAKPAFKSDKIELNSHGFITNNLKAALALAKKDNKLVFVDFGAPWCPSCVRMETEVFGEKVFADATKDLVKVAIDVDKADNKSLSKQYNIKAIPTVIVMNAQGEELYRLLDYKPAEAVASSLQQALKTSMIPLAELTKKATAGDKVAQKALGERSYNALQYGEAAKWFAMADDKDILWAKSEIYAAEKTGKPEATAKRKALLEKWISTFPGHAASVEWRAELANLIQGEQTDIKPEAKKLAEQNIELLNGLLKSEKKFKAAKKNKEFEESSDIEKVELATSLAGSYKFLKDTKSTAEAQMLAIKELQAIDFNVQQPGRILSALFYFRENGRPDLAISWLEKLMTAYPDTDVYETKLAYTYMKLKEYDKALPLAQKIVTKNPDRKLSNMKLVAEIQKELKLKKEARQTITQALKLPEAKLKHNEMLVKSFKEMKKSL